MWSLSNILDWTFLTSRNKFNHLSGRVCRDLTFITYENWHKFFMCYVSFDDKDV